MLADSWPAERLSIARILEIVGELCIKVSNFLFAGSRK